MKQLTFTNKDNLIDRQMNCSIIAYKIGIETDFNKVVETLWTGTDLREARKQFDQAEIKDDVYFIECWADSEEYGKIRLDFKW